eukprot:COSAG01_NODE_776_length_13693_cov_79.900029_1_plen_118_part_10
MDVPRSCRLSLAEARSVSNPLATTLVTPCCAAVVWPLASCHDCDWPSRQYRCANVIKCQVTQSARAGPLDRGEGHPIADGSFWDGSTVSCANILHNQCQKMHVRQPSSPPCRTPPLLA